MNLTDQKVDKSTFDNLCSQVDRIEGMIEQLDSEFYSEAEESEDSIGIFYLTQSLVEDVLSLNSIENSEDHNDGLKEQTKNSSDETPKEDHSHNIPK